MREFFNDKNLQSNPFINWFELFLVIFITWIIFSEIFELKFLLFGVISCLVISLCCLKSFKIKGIKSDKTYFLIHFNFIKALIYFIWLIKEIILSAIAVSKTVFHSNDKLSPKIVWFKADYDNPVARAFLANSITLTPGTVTIDIFDDGTYSAHALVDESADSLLSGEMQKKVAWVFNEKIDFRVLESEDVKDNENRDTVNLRNTRFSRKKRTK